MKKPNLTKIVKDTRMLMSKHSPEILTGLGIASMITTVILAVKATPKAMELIDSEVHDRHYVDNNKAPLTKMDVVKVAWKPYVPAAISGTVSVACLIGANSVNARRNAAIATAYKLSEAALSEYKDKVVEVIGEKKEKVVREKIAEDRLEKNPVNNSQIFMTEKGNTLFLEPISGQYFRSDIEIVKKTINELNEGMLNSPFGYLSVNDLYDALGLEQTSTGDDLGWCVSKGIIKFDIHAKVAKNGEPCIVLDYTNAPVYNYNKFA